MMCVASTRQEGKGLLGCAMSSEISASSMHRLGGGKEDEGLGRTLGGKAAFLGCFFTSSSGWTHVLCRCKHKTI